MLLCANGDSHTAGAELKTTDKNFATFLINYIEINKLL